MNLINSSSEKLRDTEVKYYTFTQENASTKLLLASGLHGDESSVIEPLQQFIEQNSHKMPNFLFIPEVSPSAVQLRRRHNGLYHDLNRIFEMGVEDPEELLAKKIVMKEAPYDLVVTFHEDTEYKETYFYDLGEKFYELHLQEWRNAVKNIGIELLNGLDDEDNALRKVFVDGYHYEEDAQEDGMFEHWVLHEHLGERNLTIEIPTSASLDQKKQLIELYFEHLIFPAFA
jgi:succinylglutamate desuccinylase